uniref:Aerotaxis receptor n=1 Tax=uncultured beta proteobacterium TaxID=86027 RepID=H5SNY6_9PROT|nr:aerotaxis receptor [uncultured beta proteobacterium]
MKWKIPPTQTEVTFAPDELIVSKTDPKGRITYINRVFMKVSNFTEEDALGVQHNLVRHPDMPRGAFKLLWDTIAQGNEWFGFVKNITKEGHYYWVFANVTPDVEAGRIVGYFSVRRQAPRAAIRAIEPLYTEMRRIEQEAGAAQACAASLAWLTAHLAQQGKTYESFVLNLFQSHANT